MNSLYKWQIYAVLIAAFTQRQGNYKPTRGNYTLAGFIVARFFMQIHLSVQRDKSDCDIVGGKMTAERVRIILWYENREEKAIKKKQVGKVGKSR